LNKPLSAITKADDTYEEFKEKYGLRLTQQQGAAVRQVDGASLLLAVPGSGKTTTLIARIAYMTLVKGIEPARILAITYTTKATNEMRSRFCRVYDEEIGKRVDFRTINSLGESQLIFLLLLQ